MRHIVYIDNLYIHIVKVKDQHLVCTGVQCHSWYTPEIQQLESHQVFLHDIVMYHYFLATNFVWFPCFVSSCSVQKCFFRFPSYMTFRF